MAVSCNLKITQGGSNESSRSSTRVLYESIVHMELHELLHDMSGAFDAQRELLSADTDMIYFSNSYRTEN